MPFPISRAAAFDVETRGVDDYRHALQPYRLPTGQAELTSSALAWVEDGKLRSSVERNPSADYHRRMLEWAVENKIVLVGWNMTFDAAWLCAQGLSELVMQARWLDAMLLWQHLEREPEYDVAMAKRRWWGLKAAVAEYFPAHAGYDDGIDFQDMSEEATRRRLIYNRKDVVFTLRLAQIFYNRLEEQDPRQLRNALIEAAAIAPVAERTYEGLVVDTAAARTLADVLEQERVDTLAKLNEMHAEGGHEGEVTPQVLASPVQLAGLVFDTWGLPVMKKTPKGAPSTDKESLHMLSAVDDKAPLIQAYRDARGNKKKFVDNVLESVRYNGDGRTRPSMRIYGTYTGRATYSSSQDKNKNKVQTGFAMHQMKNAPEFRRLITAPPGYVVVEWDAASQEYRWMAIESGDETMLSLCLPGEDPHSFMGARIGNVEYEWLMANKDSDKEAKKMRKAGKVGNLSCVAASTKILTSNGVKPIVEVTAADLIWDGEEFVNHGGVIFNGYREVITYRGLTATPDHKVLCGGEWVDFGCAAERGWSIDTASRGLDDNRKQDREAEWAGNHTMPLYLRKRENGAAGVLARQKEHRLRAVQREKDSRQSRPLHTTDRRGEASTEKSKRHASQVPAAESQVVQKLRGKRCRVQVPVSEGRGNLYPDISAAPYIQGSGHRPRGQQRPLRARESEAHYTQPESEKHTQNNNGIMERRDDPFTGLDGEPIRYNNIWEVCSAGDDRRGDHTESEGGCSHQEKGMERHKEKTAVYDILNCGPRNRFVANGLIVHNCQYRIGYKTLRIRANVNHGMPIDNSGAKTIHRTYHSTYRGVQRYWNRQIRKCKEKGYAETIAGRRVQLKGQWSHPQMGWRLESTAVNFPIQGIGADQKYLAIKLLNNVLPQVGGHFYFELHDGLYAILPEKTALRDGLRIRDMLSNMPYKKAWGFTPPVPLPWDMKIGPNWGDMTEVE